MRQDRIRCWTRRSSFNPVWIPSCPRTAPRAAPPALLCWPMRCGCRAAGSSASEHRPGPRGPRWTNEYDHNMRWRFMTKSIFSPSLSRKFRNTARRFPPLSGKMGPAGSSRPQAAGNVENATGALQRRRSRRRTIWAAAKAARSCEACQRQRSFGRAAMTGDRRAAVRQLHRSAQLRLGWVGTRRPRHRPDRGRIRLP